MSFPKRRWVWGIKSQAVKQRKILQKRRKGALRSRQEQVANEILMHLRAGKKNRGELLLYDPIGSDKEGNEIVLMDVLCQDWDTVADEVETRLEEKKLIEKISKLSKREKKVIELRFGIGTDHRLTQREISQVLGISRSYVSRIEKRALTKLYKDMSNEGYQ